MAIFQIQAVTVNEPATGRGNDLKMETFTKNMLHAVAGEILVKQLQIHPFFLLLDRTSGLFYNEHT
jgi:hypothetical protein